MTKQEVCDFLKKSKRTIEGYVKAGRLGQQYAEAPNGVRAMFDRAQVEAFAKQAEAPAQIVAAPRAVSNGGFEALSAHLARLSTLYPRPAALGTWVPLDEAAKISGFPKSYLMREAKAGAAWAVNAGTAKRPIWRFRVSRGAIVERSS